MLDLFAHRKHRKALQQMGGMPGVYPDLIEELKSLGQTSKENFPVITREVGDNIFSISIDFSARSDNSLLAYSDTFVLVDKPRLLKVKWKRQTHSRYQFILSDFPERIGDSFRFPKKEDQEQIFKQILRNVLAVLGGKYQYLDQHYERVFKNGNEKFSTAEKESDWKKELLDADLDWIPPYTGE